MQVEKILFCVVKSQEISNNLVIFNQLCVNKVIREKSRGEGSLIVQDTIENVSESNFFFNFLRKKKYIF